MRDDDECRHRRFHERGAIPHHEGVVRREKRAANERSAAIAHGRESRSEKDDGEETRERGHDARLPQTDPELSK
jgi:hypothetical protein